MSLPGYDKWKLASPYEDEKTVANCEQCSGEIYEGEEAYKIDSDWVHEECFFDYAVDKLDAKLRQAK